MKLKILLKLLEKVFGMTSNDDEPKADMYMPDRLFGMSLILVGLGTGCAVFSFFRFKSWLIVCAVLGFVLGIASFLCWRNQSIRVISDKQFTYTTMFGNTYTYNFYDIQGLRRNNDSLTLYVDGKQVHIDSMAILSDRLVDLVNEALEKLN